MRITTITGLFFIATLLSLPFTGKEFAIESVDHSREDFQKNEAHSQSKLTQAISSAQKIHPAPDGKWELVVQPFWKTHLVLRLVSTSFKGWYHRPTIAVSSSGKATVLTDGVIRLPQSRMISSFNEIAISENVHINRENIVSYVTFFLSSHLSNGDFLSIQAPGDSRSDSPEPTFRLRDHDNAFLVETDLVNKKNGWRTRHRFMIRKDGTVTIDKIDSST